MCAIVKPGVWGGAVVHCPRGCRDQRRTNKHVRRMPLCTYGCMCACMLVCSHCHAPKHQEASQCHNEHLRPDANAANAHAARLRRQAAAGGGARLFAAEAADEAAEAAHAAVAALAAEGVGADAGYMERTGERRERQPKTGCCRHRSGLSAAAGGGGGGGGGGGELSTEDARRHFVSRVAHSHSMDRIGHQHYNTHTHAIVVTKALCLHSRVESLVSQLDCRRSSNAADSSQISSIVQTSSPQPLAHEADMERNEAFTGYAIDMR